MKGKKLVHTHTV